MNDTKTNLLQELDNVRNYLWGVVETVDPAIELYPGWSKRDFFAHIAGWEALVFESLRAYLFGIASESYTYSDLETANRDFVSMRQSATTASVKLECEIYRFAIKTMLSAIPADQYINPVRFPWGQETVIAFLQGAIDHERKHADEIVALKTEGRMTPFNT